MDLKTNLALSLFYFQNLPVSTLEMAKENIITIMRWNSTL